MELVESICALRGKIEKENSQGNGKAVSPAAEESLDETMAMAREIAGRQRLET